MISAIVAGFDGSEPSERALRFACQLAKTCEASLEIMHTPRDETVVYAAEAISGFYVGTTEIQRDHLVEAAEEMATRARAIAADCGFPDVEVHIGHGDPARDIIARVKDAKADLIVTGRRGLGNLGSFVMGSTSQQIARDAECPCVTVP